LDKKDRNLVNANTALPEALYKAVKITFQHSNKVDFVPVMSF
jgi:hypothetical protein